MQFVHGLLPGGVFVCVSYVSIQDRVCWWTRSDDKLGLADSTIGLQVSVPFDLWEVEFQKLTVLFCS